MAEHEHIQGIEPVEELNPTNIRSIETTDPTDTESASRVKFDEAVQKADPTRVEQRTTEQQPIQEATSVKEAHPSPLELASRAAEQTTKVQPVAPDELAAQATKLRDQIEHPRAQLYRAERLQNDKILPLDVLSANEKTQLSGHLEHTDRALREASELTTGVEVGSAVDNSKPPFTQYLKYLTESDKKLSSIVDEIQSLDLRKTRLTPSIMMAVQIKMGFAQQEIEFFTATLNKALESVKTIFNVQI